jgi:hypothetical protein
MWGKDLDLQLELVEWSPDGRNILFCTGQSDVQVFNSVAARLGEGSLSSNYPLNPIWGRRSLSFSNYPCESERVARESSISLHQLSRRLSTNLILDSLYSFSTISFMAVGM